MIGGWVSAGCLAAVRLSFAGIVNDSLETTAKLLQDDPLSHRLRLIGQFCLLRLLHQAVTGCFCHFLSNECVGKPAIGRKISQQLAVKITSQNMKLLCAPL